MIVVDVETTGLDPTRLSILSIGAVDFDDPNNTFYVECKPWENASDVSKEALGINGFDLEQLKRDGMNQDEAIEAFINWAILKNGKPVLAGHNVWFDRDCLKEMAHRAVVKWPFGHHVVDTFSLAAAVALKNYKPLPAKQKDMFELAGLPEEPHPHNALTGAKMEREALWNFIFDPKEVPANA
jgi:DNA polymerase III epsilon subunit-like protein